MVALRSFNLLDKICINLDQILRTITDQAPTTGLPNPAKETEEGELTEKERKHAAALIRVNHAGEIAAQALYHAQGLVAKKTDIKKKMQQAALEEGDHLAWCKQRIEELGGRTSYLNPFWYTGSFCIGLAVGMIGDKWSLGFIAETEHQVIKHLKSHLKLLPPADHKSYKILQQMEKDEAAHKAKAMLAGAKYIPYYIQKVMKLSAKVMVKTAYWI